MGGGSWDPGTYTRSTKAKIDSGTSFSYSSSTYTKSRDTWAVHEDLDPKKVAGSASPLAGQIVRESRDNDEHPNATPLAVFFDETGSMGSTPRLIQSKLPDLFGLLLRKGYVEDPQIMTGAYGDALSDRVPLQVSQFESDNRIDDALDKLFLEGNGGGNHGESQWLTWYYLARHTATDAWDKRQKQGYAFFIGDEIVHDPKVSEVKQYINPDCTDESLTLEGIVKELLVKWDAYVFVIDNGSARQQGSIAFYTELFGRDRVLVVENEDAIAETIALTVGMREGVIDLDDGVDDLTAAGASTAIISQTKKALAHVGSGGAVVTSSAPSDIDAADDDAVTTV